jgi:hypothetical protein
MRIIGDVHGKVDQYLELIKEVPSSFQLGDFGFQGAWDKLNYCVDPVMHRVGQGNHDPHDILQNYPHWVGRFGEVLQEQKFFWIGGALSIDMVYRVGEWMSNNRKPTSKTWWATEQLGYEEMEECKRLYLETKPELVISHTAPEEVIDLFNTNKGSNIMADFGWGAGYHDMTSQFLSHLWEQHQPKLWIFGHFHKSFDKEVMGTRFKCLAELEFFDI